MKDGIRVEIAGCGAANSVVKWLYEPQLNPKLMGFDIVELLQEVAARGCEPHLSHIGDSQWLRFDVDMGAPTTAE